MSQHYSNTMVVRCADDRYSENRELEPAFLEILKKEGAKDCYQAFGFGAGLEIVKEKYWPLWQDRVRLAKSLGVTRVILIQHLDCGAVKAEFGIEDKAEERQRHIEIIHAAKRFFEENAPEFAFVAYLQDFDSYTKID